MLTAGWPRNTRPSPNPAPPSDTVQTTAKPVNAPKKNPRVRLKLRRPSKVYETYGLQPVKPQVVAGTSEPGDDFFDGLSSPPTPAPHADSTSPPHHSQGRGRRFLFRDPEAHISHRLRSSFIARVASTKRWRPRLAYRLIPKYIHVLDGPCTAFLLRHLTTLQPLEHEALLSHIPTTSHAGQQHTMNYLHHPSNTQPTTPTAFKPPWLWRQHGIRASPASQDAHQPPQPLTEREEFTQVVQSICLYATHKLHTFSGGVLSDCAAALGDLHVNPPHEFWKAWEAATLPLLHDMVTSQIDDDPDGPSANQGCIRLGLRPCHLGNMLLGVAKCRHVASSEWQQAMWSAMHASIHGHQLQIVDLTELCEGWALTCLEQHIQGATHKCIMQPELMHTLCNTLQHQLQQHPNTSERFNVAPLLALGAHLHAASAGRLPPITPPVAQFARSFVTTWVELTMPLLMQGCFTRRTAAAALWAMYAVMASRHPQDAQESPKAANAFIRLTPSIQTWLNTALLQLVKPGTAQTATHVHVGMVCVYGMRYTPPAQLKRSVVRAAQDTLPAMTPAQLIDVLTVLQTWRVRSPSAWAASLSVYAHCRGDSMTAQQKQALNKLAPHLLST